MIQKTKAQTLLFLKNKVTKSKVLSSLILKANENIEDMIFKIKNQFEDKVIVRSSAFNEDSNNSSNAGHYKSVLNVNATNEKDVKNALITVLSSYEENAFNKNEILVQPMLFNVISSGVVFSCDIDTLSPYYIVNYDKSSDTCSVTDGRGKELQTYIEYKYVSNLKRQNPFLDKLIIAVQEIEQILENACLDIEFGYDGKDIYIFQARPIIRNNKLDLSDINLEKALFKLHKKITKLNSPHPNLLGNRTMFGIMPDWNPAEIIGKKPKPLSLSLYKELVTDSIWAYQRDNYGYRNLQSHPLLVSLLGVAYIDVRVSLNSFIPKNLDKNIAEKLVNYYLDTLQANPSNHDKIEFNIILSCLDFSTAEKLYKLYYYNFNQEELLKIKNSLQELTNNIFLLYKKDLQKIEILKDKYQDITSSKLALIDKIYWLNENCKRYGTLPFAGLARSAFIAVSFLKSFVEKEIISHQEYSDFLNSINTISKELGTDFIKLSKDEFLEKYGHLRPGTYEITSKRYDENFDEYFSINEEKIKDEKEFQFSRYQLEKIDFYLKEFKLDITVENLIKFITESIEAREYSKFIFTKSLSQILLLLEELGNKYNILKQEMAYIDYKTVLSLYSNLTFEDIDSLLKNEIQKNKKLYKITQGIKLPDLLINQDEIYSFYQLKSSANFITLNSIESQLVKEENIFKDNLKNKIICIKSADPGYDFLFTKNIGGLVTCYGGANSHMAIRCAELNIPAIIGIGEIEYSDLKNYSYVSLDCNIQKLKKIR